MNPIKFLRSRRWRISIGSLMVAIAVIGVLISWFRPMGPAGAVTIARREIARLDPKFPKDAHVFSTWRTEVFWDGKYVTQWDIILKEPGGSTGYRILIVNNRAVEVVPAWDIQQDRHGAWSATYGAR